ncbi:MAG: glycoside hydrolase [Cyclobacteriaceae bacterium]|nr:glycoside hydrolase [Cyclobacteriaceae bacterium]
MKTVGLILLVIFWPLDFSIAQNRTIVFASGTEGHKVYRIPAMIKLSNGILLAFCEGRVSGGSDFGDINIVMKSSADDGNTWSLLQTIVDYDSLQAGNPAPVVDQADPNYPGGRIFLFYNTGNNHENEIRKGIGLREVWYKTSTDNGLSWSDPVNITAQVHRPNQPQINSEYRFSEDWRSYANTPGHAMQFESGKFRGRIFVAANHSAGDPQPEYRDYAAHGYFTDDHGRTFHLGESVEIPGSNESMATELSEGRLMMNSRNQRGDIRARIVSISNSGGVQWDTSYFDSSLPDPVCQASILSLGKWKGKNVLAFCNAADAARRDNLTLYISFDEGRRWEKRIPVDKSTDGNRNDYTAYSDIIKISKSKIGILYERDGYSQLVFTAIDLR